MIYATQPTSQDRFAEHFSWYLTHEDMLALQERDNKLACACRDTFADLFPISSTSERKVDAFNAACAAYREGMETEQMSTRSS